MLNHEYFTKYLEDGEIKTDSTIGEYWKFLDASYEQIDSSAIMCSSLCKIILEIQNPELKGKMKDKLIGFIKYKGVTDSYFEYSYSSGLFTQEEAVDILKHDCFIKKITNKQYDKNDLFFTSNCNSYINACSIVDDINFQSGQIIKILDEIVTLDNSDGIITRILNNISTNKNDELFNIVYSKYSNYIPETYKKFVKASNDRDYVYKKSLKFADEGIRIGIDPKISIGVEIETNHPYGLHYDCSCQNQIYGLYKTETDPTVPNGIEIVSKPFNDTVEDVSKFCALCETLSEVGYSYDEESENASGQINLGLDYLDSAQSIINFYEIFCNVEELLFYISNGDNQLTRQELYLSSRFKPISEIIGIRSIDEDLTRDQVIELFNSRYNDESKNTIHGLTFKKNSICLRGTYDDDYRFEVRIPNGGNDYKIWLDNIRLYGKMMEASKHLADLKHEDYITEADEKKLNILYELKYDKLEMDEKLIILMDLLFDEPEIKKIYFERYVNTIKKIKETHTDKYYVPYAFKQEPMFGKTILNQEPHSKINDEPVAFYDPETGEYIEDGRRKARF